MNEELENKLEFETYKDNFGFTKIMFRLSYKDKVYEAYHIIVEPMTETQIDHIFDEAKSLIRRRIERERRRPEWTE